jgi:hypothetical protein
VQAAEALGVSASTISRSVVQVVETFELDGGRVLIPVDELQRYLAERRRPVPPPLNRAPVGRPAAVPSEIAKRIPTAQGGRRWWPSSVRAVLLRSEPP